MKYIASAVLFGVAGLIATSGMDGWGWFLFVGALICL